MLHQRLQKRKSLQLKRQRLMRRLQWKHRQLNQLNNLLGAPALSGAVRRFVTRFELTGE